MSRPDSPRRANRSSTMGIRADARPVWPGRDSTPHSGSRPEDSHPFRWGWIYTGFLLVDIAGLPSRQTFHQSPQTGDLLARLQHQMDRIGHEAERVNLDAEDFLEFGQGCQVVPEIVCLGKDCLLVMSPLHPRMRVIRHHNPAQSWHNLSVFGAGLHEVPIHRIASKINSFPNTTEHLIPHGSVLAIRLCSNIRSISASGGT
jgi:hypothetical protein